MEATTQIEGSPRSTIVRRIVRRKRAQTWMELWVYAVLLCVSVSISDIWNVTLGICLSAALTAVLLVRGTQLYPYPSSRIFLTMSILPLIGIVSIAIPPQLFSGVWCYIIPEGTIFLSAIGICIALRLNPRGIGLCLPKSFLLSLVILFSGLVAGWTESYIVHPTPLANNLHWTTVLIPTLMLSLFSFGEEFLFRGVLFSLAAESHGRLGAVLFVSFVWTVMHIGWHSLLDVAFVFLVGILWGFLRTKSQSILELSLAHGIANVLLFIVIPNIVSLGRNLL